MNKEVFFYKGTGDCSVIIPKEFHGGCGTALAIAMRTKPQEWGRGERKRLCVKETHDNNREPLFSPAF